MSDVVISVEGAVGRLRLSRPKAIHALTRPMCVDMINALLAWRADPAVKLVVIDHAEGRGFCAGGDVLMVARSARKDGREAREFFFDEYRLNHLLFSYPKTTIAVMDGITMGGGVGISLPCDYRVATENTRLAMPETAIGLFPDVGAGWFLSRLPGRIGEFMALTGARLDGAECHYLGLATHYVASDKREELIERLRRAPTRAKGALGALSAAVPEARIAANQANINKLFGADTVEEIVAALEADGSDWAASELATLKSKSPQSCKVALRLLRESRARRDFADEMKAEFALANRIVRTHDLPEGVRALLIDKDNAPRWDPATFEQVDPAMLDALFEPLPPEQAWTPVPEKAGTQ